MKAALRKLSPDQLAVAYEDANQPRSTTKQERTAHGKIQKKDLVFVAKVNKAIRPLNSWIAYRSKSRNSTNLMIIINKVPGYYSTIFLKFQQKEISGFLTVLWQADPFKAKWSIIAKSYSVIRNDQGKANAPLEKFLAINAPLIGIIEPAQYLEALNWEVAVDEVGQTVVRRNGDSIDEQLFITNVSVNDVIRNSYDEGYFTGDLSKVLLANNEATMTMATSVQPTSNAQLESNDAADFAVTANNKGSSKENEQVPTTMVIDDDEKDSAMATNANEDGSEESMVEDNDDAPGSSATVVTENALPAGDAPAVMTATGTSASFNPENLGPGSSLHIDADMTDIQSRQNTSTNDPGVSSLSASAFSLKGEYPFNTEFDPDYTGATFNPFMGNHFDVFEMSETSWDEFIDFDASA